MTINVIILSRVFGNNYSLYGNFYEIYKHWHCNSEWNHFMCTLYPCRSNILLCYNLATKNFYVRQWVFISWVLRSFMTPSLKIRQKLPKIKRWQHLIAVVPNQWIWGGKQWIRWRLKLQLKIFLSDKLLWWTFLLVTITSLLSLFYIRSYFSSFQ